MAAHGRARLVTAPTLSAGAVRRAIRMVIMSMCGVDTGVRNGRIDSRARLAGKVARIKLSDVALFIKT